MQAKAVIDEIKIRLRKCIREAPFQQEDRLDKEFEALMMRNMTHVEVIAQFEAKLDELEDAGMYLEDEHQNIKHMRRKYLSKMTDDLRSAVLNKSWELDGEGTQARKPTTWYEVADALEIELSSRADVKAPKD